MMKMLGCRTKVVENGEQVLKALVKEEYNLVLMDGQMPVVDGYEATRRIRAGEAGEANLRIPIIATTANAIQGDIEKCLEAGMNDYIGKPISYDDLAFKVEKWMTRGKKVIDPNALKKLSMVAQNSNPLLVTELIQLFESQTPSALNEIKECLTTHDATAIAKKAHLLKSEAANLGAMRMRDLCERIERSASAQSLQHISVLVDSLEREFHLAKEELNRHKTPLS
jgi:CheY-like chemotaxis protein